MEANISEIRDMVERIAGQPPATVAEVKQVVTADHAAIEQRQTEIMEALHTEKT
jgi:hypothetical protein